MVYVCELKQGITFDVIYYIKPQNELLFITTILCSKAEYVRMTSAAVTKLQGVPEFYYKEIMRRGLG
jgi:hypothetical protein